VIRFSLIFRRLDQQPLLPRGLTPLGIVVRRANSPLSEPRGQGRAATIPRWDLLLVIGGRGVSPPRQTIVVGRMPPT
jgi:hypothetical protein